MNNNLNSAESLQHRFVFHGNGGRFFIICLLNFLLSIITLGIYLPWALVNSRRYIYEHTELNGARFGYHASGSVFFVSWLLTGLLFIIATLVCALFSPNLAALPMLALLILLPLMVVRGLRYQSMMTTLNNVRFGFRCGSGRALWVMLLLPLLSGIAAMIIIIGVARIMGEPSGMNAAIVHLVVIVLLALALLGVIYGINYGKWMQLLGEGASFGIHRFSITVNIKRCIRVCLIAMAMLIPFMLVIGKLIIPLLIALTINIATGRMDAYARVALVQTYQLEIIVSYLLYIMAIVLTSVFIVTALRNLFINGLRLGNALTFRSTITFTGLLMQFLVLFFATALTMGLAYPWAKIRLIRYLAHNTLVVGNLDDVELKDSEEKVATGFFAAAANGMAPALPFI